MDLTGWVMSEHGVPESRWTVLKQVDDYINPTNGKRISQWLCECSCEEHNQIIVLRNHLTGKNAIKSCGCLRKEWIANLNNKRNKENKYNNYDIDSFEYGVGWTYNTNQEFYFDLEDYDLIKDYCWCEHIHPRDGYHSLRAYDKLTRKQIHMHRLLVDYDICDHINRNALDNRKSNLRPATVSQNGCNRNLGCRNKSGVIGVFWNKHINQWIAYISIDKKLATIGYFINKDDAIKARLYAERKYYGEFAPQKHLYEQYEIT